MLSRRVGPVFPADGGGAAPAAAGRPPDDAFPGRHRLPAGRRWRGGHPWVGLAPVLAAVAWMVVAVVRARGFTLADRVGQAPGWQLAACAGLAAGGLLLAGINAARRGARRRR